MSQTLTELQQKQLRQAEELLFSGPQKDGFAKDLFLGKFRSQSMLPYPKLPDANQRRGNELLAQVRDYCERHIDAARIDREARIPDEVVAGLGNLGVLGATVRPKHGGLGISQQT
jgi:alkylation response protein AidB-like acyl-CoA dehydrogenase